MVTTDANCLNTQLTIRLPSGSAWRARRRNLPLCIATYAPSDLASVRVREVITVKPRSASWFDSRRVKVVFIGERLADYRGGSQGLFLGRKAFFIGRAEFFNASPLRRGGVQFGPVTSRGLFATMAAGKIKFAPTICASCFCHNDILIESPTNSKRYRTNIARFDIKYARHSDSVSRINRINPEGRRTQAYRVPYLTISNAISIREVCLTGGRKTRTIFKY